MNRVLVAILCLCPALCWGKATNAADYTVSVHVQSSHFVSECKGSSSLTRCGTRQHLDVVILGKKYELNSKDDVDAVLRTGNYMARSLQDNPPSTAFEYQMEFEFLLPDGTTRKYRVVGETE